MLKLIINHIIVLVIGVFLSLFFLYFSPFKTGSKADIMSIFNIFNFYFIIIIVTIIVYLLIKISNFKNLIITIITTQFIAITILLIKDDYYTTNLTVCVPIFVILEYIFLYRKWENI